MLRQHYASLRVAAVLALFILGSAAAWADCRGEVEAEIQRLAVPDRPYRSEMTVGRNYRETTEFIPPDRMRKIADSHSLIERIVLYLVGAGPFEAIQIGNRTWERLEKKWVEDGLSPKQIPGTSPPEALPPNTTFACLGAVAFESAIYTGYQISFRPTRVAFLTLGT